MKKYTLPLALLLILAPSAARAQVSVHIDLGLPIMPRLVVVQPGIQVVEGFQEEVFFCNGWYWCRRHDGWYRARSPRERFAWIEGPRVPRSLMRVPEGHYRNWHRGEPRHFDRREPRHDQREAAHERRDERQDRHEAMRDQRKVEHRDGVRDRKEAGHDRGKPNERREEGEHGRREH